MKNFHFQWIQGRKQRERNSGADHTIYTYLDGG